jgi:hypothetical protein
MSISTSLPSDKSMSCIGRAEVPPSSTPHPPSMPPPDDENHIQASMALLRLIDRRENGGRFLVMYGSSLVLHRTMALDTDTTI